MLTALDANGDRKLATPKSRGICPGCRREVRAKCGRVTVWHWAHLERDCDSFSEPMTAWHRDWQATVPETQREVVIGPHRADIRTHHGLVVELQHSGISADEISERETFYGPDMIWVFDAVAAYDQARRDAEEQMVFRYREAKAQAMAVHPVDCDRCRGPLARTVPPDYLVERCVEIALTRRADVVTPPLYAPPGPRLSVRGRGERPDGYVTFRWKQPRKSLAACGRPMFLDLGNGELLLVKKLYPEAQCGGWGYLWSREVFIAKLNEPGPGD